MHIYAVGKQWMWKFQHLEGQREINELHVPVGRPIKITVTSEDVLHSLYFPAFRTKIDAIPGPLHGAVVRGDQGRDVSHLLRRVLRHESLGDDRLGDGDGAGRRIRRGWPAAAKARWPSAARRSSSSWRATPAISIPGRAAGRRSRTSSASRWSWPTARRWWSTRAYLRESILNSQAKIVKGFQPLMPTFQGLISEEGLVALIEHVKSMSPTRTATATGAPGAGGEVRPGHASGAAAAATQRRRG